MALGRGHLVIIGAREHGVQHEELISVHPELLFGDAVLFLNLTLQHAVMPELRFANCHEFICELAELRSPRFRGASAARNRGAGQ